MLQMLVDDIGDVTITNDGATILRLLEVEHPAAKVCVHDSQCLYLPCTNTLLAHVCGRIQSA